MSWNSYPIQGGRTDADGPSIRGAAYAQIGLSVGHWHPAAAAPPPPPPCSKRPSSSTGEPHSCYTIQSNDERERERDDRAREKNLIPGHTRRASERGTLLSPSDTKPEVDDDDDGDGGQRNLARIYLYWDSLILHMCFIVASFADVSTDGWIDSGSG